MEVRVIDRKTKELKVIADVVGIDLIDGFITLSRGGAGETEIRLIDLDDIERLVARDESAIGNSKPSGTIQFFK